MSPEIQSTITQIMVGGAGEVVGGLLFGMLHAAGTTVKSRFQSHAEEKALTVALETALQTAFEETLESVSGVPKYYLECLGKYLQQNTVQRELSALLSRSAIDMDALEKQFLIITQGYKPE